MKETNELLEHIYKDASMGSYTMEHLLGELKDRDNKIKGLAEDILKESNFSVRDNLIFDKMFQNFVKHDYKIIA